MEHSKLYYEVLDECKNCIKQWKEENGGILPIQYGDYLTHCWNYGGQNLQDAIDALMQEENECEVTPILECEIMAENVGVAQANRIRIGSRLRELRETQGLTTTRLGERCGLSHSTISKIENGKWSVSLDILSKVCEALGVRVEIV